MSNYLHLLSAAIGTSTPDLYMWRLCIVLQLALRLLMTSAYWHHYRDYRYPHLCRIILGLGLGENLGLLLRTCVFFAKSHPFHQDAFGLFIILAIGHMFFNYLLWQLTKKNTVSAEECKWKWQLFLFNLLNSICFYFHHIWHCEAGVYVVFVFLEYLAVLSNMTFHMTTRLDF